MDAKIIGARLRTLRESNGLSRSDCAVACGVSVSAWQMYENGERIPRDQVKLKVAEMFNKPVGEIFFE